MKLAMMMSLVSKQNILKILVVCTISLSILLCLDALQTAPPHITQSLHSPEKAYASYQYTPTGGAVITGTATSTNGVHFDSWRATTGNDSTTNGSGNYWTIARTAAGLNVQLQFDGVELHGANKMLITMEDSNQNSASAYVHQICDWISASNVDNAADAQCTGGGWRTLQPRRTTYTTNASDTSRTYEIFDGYFSTRTTAPGASFSTPLSNFIESTNKRVLIRASSTVSGTQELRIDYARVEVAIDSAYEPVGIATTSASSTMSGFISDLVGAVSTNLTASDGNKMTITMPATAQPIDFYYTFDNVKTLEGMNTIHVVPEICVSNAELQFSIFLYNFTTAEWSVANATSSATACATDTEYGFSFNDTLVPGFVLDDYIQNGEVRVRFLTNAPATVRNMQFDRIYMMIGSVNTNTALCEISFGTGTDTNCDRTRSMAEGITLTPSTTTWQSTTESEYPTNIHPFDHEDDAAADKAQSMNLSFPLVVATNTAITGIHYAAKYRSNTTTITNDLQLLKYGGAPGVGGEAAGQAWYTTPATETNNSTTYGYFDTWRLTEIELSPDDFVDTYNDLMNLRLRTSAATNGIGINTTNDWDFALVSVRWVEKFPAQYIQFSISDNSVGFGTLTSVQTRYATGDLQGLTTETVAHTLRAASNAPLGYSIVASGTTLTCEACGFATIDPIGGTAAAPSVGTEQFGMRLELLSGTGATTAPYDTALYAFDSLSFPDQIATGNGDDYESTYNVYYMANRTSETDSGEYTGVITYTVTTTY